MYKVSPRLVFAVLPVLLCTAEWAAGRSAFDEPAACGHAALAKQRAACIAAATAQLHATKAADVAQGCATIGHLRVTAALPVIESLLRAGQSNTEVASECVRAAGRIGTPEAAELLRALAADPGRSAVIRASAVRAASQVEGMDRGYLVRLLNDPDPQVQAEAAYSVGQLRVENGAVGLQALLASPDSSARQAAVTAASVWPERFQPELAHLASAALGQEPSERLEALTALSTLSADAVSQGTRERIEALATSTQEPSVAAAARQVLEPKFGAQPAAPSAAASTPLPSINRPPPITLPPEGTPNPLPARPDLIFGAAVALALALAIVLQVSLVATQRRRAAELAQLLRLRSRWGPADADEVSGAPVLVHVYVLCAAYFLLWAAYGVAASSPRVMPNVWEWPLTLAALGALGSYLSTLARVATRALHDEIDESVPLEALVQLATVTAGAILLACLPHFPEMSARVLILGFGLAGPSMLIWVKDYLIRRADSNANEWHSQSLPLSVLDGIDPRDVDRLRRLHIRTVEQFAQADVREVLMRTPYSLHAMCDWMDQALLLTAFPGTTPAKLRAAGLPARATQLLRIRRLATSDPRDGMAGALAVAPLELEPRLRLLEDNPRVRALASIEVPAM